MVLGTGGSTVHWGCQQFMGLGVGPQFMVLGESTVHGPGVSQQFMIPRAVQVPVGGGRSVVHGLDRGVGPKWTTPPLSTMDRVTLKHGPLPSDTLSLTSLTCSPGP